MAEFWFRLISQKNVCQPTICMNSICLCNDFISFCSLDLSCVVRWLKKQRLFARFIICCSWQNCFSSCLGTSTKSGRAAIWDRSTGSVYRTPFRTYGTIHKFGMSISGTFGVRLWWYAAVVWITVFEWKISTNLNGYNEKWNPGIRSNEHEKLTITAAWHRIVDLDSDPWFLLFWDFFFWSSYLKKDVNVSSKSNKLKKLEIKYIFSLASRSRPKILGSGSGSIGQKPRSTDPDLKCHGSTTLGAEFLKSQLF